MKTVPEIYDTIISKIQPFAFSSQSSRKPNMKDYREYNNRLITLIVGLIIGADLSGDKIDRLAEQISKLSGLQPKRK